MERGILMLGALAILTFSEGHAQAAEETTRRRSLSSPVVEERMVKSSSDQLPSEAHKLQKETPSLRRLERAENSSPNQHPRHNLSEAERKAKEKVIEQGFRRMTPASPESEEKGAKP